MREYCFWSWVPILVGIMCLSFSSFRVLPRERANQEIRTITFFLFFSFSLQVSENYYAVFSHSVKLIISSSEWMTLKFPSRAKEKKVTLNSCTGHTDRYDETWRVFEKNVFYNELGASSLINLFSFDLCFYICLCVAVSTDSFIYKKVVWWSP